MVDNYQTVTELNNYIKYILDNDIKLNQVFLKGEISNFKNHSRGHLYFTLKDEEGRINAVMFYGNARSLKFTPEDGMKVLIKGRVSAYPASGTYQIYVDGMELDGLGNLYLEYEKLKKKLLEEGLFNKEHKKEIPKYPNRIGVITAPTGAAVRDIISTIKRRYPIAEVILFPTLVQGDDAAPQIVEQIRLADTYNLDTIIIGRGGGSIEDLWAFNEEVVARAIYNANTPIISAVGHEPDFTISDFVADLRAPTPTGAGELAVPSITDLKNTINQYRLRSNNLIKSLVNTKFIELKRLKESFILKNPMSLYEIKEQKLDKLIDTINNIIEKRLINTKHNLDYIINTLKLVNPLNILSNGYSLVRKNNNVIKSSKDLKINDEVNIKFHEGEITGIVKEIK